MCKVKQDTQEAWGLARRLCVASLVVGGALAARPVWAQGTAPAGAAAAESDKPAAAGTGKPAFRPTLRSEQGQTLVLNGIGTRYRAVFRVYDLALYLPQKSSNRDAIVQANQPCRLEFIALRNINSTDIGLAFIQGMKANATREQVSRHMGAMSQLIEIFSSRPGLVPGDTFGMEYVPGKGTIFRIVGRQYGQAVGDAEFFRMVLGIWLGDSAVEPLLRDQLLGL